MTHRTRTLTTLSFFSLALTLGCDDGGPDGADAPSGSGGGGPEVSVQTSSLERDLAPAVPDADRSELAEGNRAFAFDLYAALAGDDGNLFLSPYSISSALAMTYAGARGDTEAEMAATLHFTLPQAALHPALNQLDLELESRADAAPPPSLPDGLPPRLEITNAIWGQQGYAFEPVFLDTLAASYGAGLRTLDFGADPEGARGVINAWVADQTEDRIPDLIPEGAISPLVRLVLTNAIYFLANWAYPFEPQATSPGSFVTAAGSEVTVDVMHQTESLPYAAGDGWVAVSLPYVGHQLSMLVVLPDAGRFDEVEAALGSELYATIDASLTSARVALALPRWEVKSRFQLAGVLAELGMPRAFQDGVADFSGMTAAEALHISAVIHQTFVRVDEQGTEAAAATAVLMAGNALPPEPVAVTVDRPFLYLVRDEPTGTLLFLGRVTDPS